MCRHALLPAPLAALLACALPGAAQFTNTVNVTISNQINSSAGVNGRLQVAMSTNLQLVPGSAQFFAQTPGALPALNALQPEHTRMQMTSASAPLTAPGIWDFSQLNAFLPPIQTSGDHSPEFQIASAPGFMNESKPE